LTSHFRKKYEFHNKELIQGQPAAADQLHWNWDSEHVVEKVGAPRINPYEYTRERIHVPVEVPRAEDDEIEINDISAEDSDDEGSEEGDDDSDDDSAQGGGGGGGGASKYRMQLAAGREQGRRKRVASAPGEKDAKPAKSAKPLADGKLETLRTRKRLADEVNTAKEAEKPATIVKPKKESKKELKKEPKVEKASKGRDHDPFVINGDIRGFHVDLQRPKLREDCGAGQHTRVKNLFAKRTRSNFYCHFVLGGNAGDKASPSTVSRRERRP
jgi:hypothetical protein